MSTLPPCPKCNCEFTYEDGSLCVCPECAHEWDHVPPLRTMTWAAGFIET